MKKTPLKRKTPLRAKKPLARQSIKSVRKTAGRGKNKPKKGKSQARLKKDLDAIFSKYIRQVYADNDGYVSCFTCGKLSHYKKIQNGHFVSRQYLATRWEEDNCRPQCVGCNLFGNGQVLDFEENLKKELGSDRVEELKFSRHQVLKLDRHWYEEQITFYKEALSRL